MLTTSPGFEIHNRDIHNRYGIKSTDNDAVVEEIRNLGGSLEELEMVINAAKGSAMFGDSYDNVLESVAGLTNKKRKSTDDGKMVKKKASVEIGQVFLKELNKPGGVEDEFNKNFLGRVDVLLGNILDDQTSSLPPLDQQRVHISWIWEK